MSTTEDVFWLYERNKNIEYNSCIKICIPCPNFFNNECICNSSDPVLPITIGEQTIPCRFKVKSYIKFGEECPICFEPIQNKTNAYLTGCGHAFHRKCLFNTFRAKWEMKTFSTLRCPICRCSLGYPETLERYNCDCDERYNFLDNLENFWLCKEYKTPDFCNSGNHYLGMKKDCNICINYRNHGYCK